MKITSKLLLVLLLVGIVGTGCKKLLDVKFKADFVTNLNAVVPATTLKAGVDGTFTVTETIDPKSNSTFAQYANKIVDLQILEVTAEIVAISKPVTLVNGSLTVTTEDHASEAAWSFTNEDLFVGKKLTIGNENGQFSKVRNMLKDMKTIIVTLSGTTDQDDVTFTLKVTYKTEVTANPL